MVAVQLEMFSALESDEEPERERCMSCGEEIEDFGGLDMTGNSLDWTPCCEWMREAVAAWGWEGVFGRSLADDVESLHGERPSEIYDGGYEERVEDVEFDDGSIARAPVMHARADDYLCRFHLEIVDPTEVLPDGRCKSPDGWQTEIFDAVAEHHRHHEPPQGWKFGVECWNGNERVGVAVAGRPVSRMIEKNEPRTLEVTRVATFGDSRLRRNASSKLYAACAKTARKTGATKLITYTHEGESGHSVKASGFVEAAKSSGGTWSRSRRARKDKAPTTPKTRWERKI